MAAGVDEFSFTGTIDGDTVRLKVSDPERPDLGSFEASGSIDGETLEFKQGSAGEAVALATGDDVAFEAKVKALE